jgi:hypothetical protein
MEMHIGEYSGFITAIALGLGLSASCGFRVFLPLLMASLGAKFNFLPITDSFAWMGSIPVIITLAVATVAELGAYYIPVIDNALDSLAAPASVIAGTMLSASFLNIDDPMIKWGLGLIVGGGAAGAIQAGTTATRLVSTATTGGIANPIVTTIEHIFAFVGSLLTILLPIFMAILFIVIIFFFHIWIVRYFIRRRKKASVAINTQT